MTVAIMGTDPHLDSCALAVIDEVMGTVIEETIVGNDGAGWDEAIKMCRRHNVARVGVEGASGYGRRLSQVLTRVGIEVVEIPTRLTARMRRIDGASKSDPGDAVAVARAGARPDVHRWQDEPDLEVLRVLVHRRETLVSTQTSEINALRALLVEVDPERAASLGRLRTTRQFDRLAKVRYGGDPHRETVAALIRELARDCRQRLARIRDMKRRIIEALPPIGWELVAKIHGCAELTAALLLAELAGTDGFATDAKLAKWAGAAPLDASSGKQQHHRLNRGGNRQANRALHTIIITQLSQHGEAVAYLEKRHHKTKKFAIRALKRHLARRIWKILHNHQPAPTT